MNDNLRGDFKPDDGGKKESNSSDFSQSPNIEHNSDLDKSIYENSSDVHDSVYGENSQNESQPQDGYSPQYLQNDQGDYSNQQGYDQNQNGYNQQNYNQQNQSNYGYDQNTYNNQGQGNQGQGGQGKIWFNTKGTTYPTNANDSERTLSLILYLSSFVTIIVAPLIIWLIKKDESSFIDYHGKEYLNFAISVAIYSLVASILSFVFIGILLYPVIFIYSVVFTIIAAVNAYKGLLYRIPFTIRILQ